MDTSHNEAPEQALVIFNDDRVEERSASDERNDTEINIRKKDSLQKLARLPDLLPGRTSSKSLVTKNILNEHHEEIVFETGLKLTLNPEKGEERPQSQLDMGGSGVVYQPGKKRRKAKFLPPLLKDSNMQKQQEIVILSDRSPPPFLPQEQASSAQIVMKSNRDRDLQQKLRQQSLLLYRINTDALDRRAFMMSPVPLGLVLQCTVRRDKSTFSKRYYPEYSLHLSDSFQFVAAAKRLPYHCNSTYNMSLEANQLALTDEGCLGQLKSNFWGSVFQFFDCNANRADPKLLGRVMYASSCCQAASPRDMSCQLIAQTLPNNSQFSSVQKSVTASSNSLISDNVIQLTSKKPRYDQVRKVFVMRFGNRVKRSSVKNFILVKKEEEDKNVVLFGKCTKQLFSLDISHPVTPLQGFALALSSFDKKLVSE